MTERICSVFIPNSGGGGGGGGAEEKEYTQNSKKNCFLALLCCPECLPRMYERGGSPFYDQLGNA